jgi:uncharacterized protein YraI
MRSIRTLLLAGATTAALVLAGIAPATAAVQQAPTAAVTAQTTMPPPVTIFRLPLAAKTYSLTSHFGPRCIPVRYGPTVHRGVDMGAAGGSPIAAIAGGIVIATVDGTSTREGYITIKHNFGGVEYRSVYMHVWSSTTHVKVGQLVRNGQRIGSVGSSGASSGNHLHLELWQSTASGLVAVDPAAFLKKRGVDLYGSAYRVTAQPTPATCTYYTVGGVNFRTGPSTNHSIIRMLPLGTAVVHVPGLITTGFIPVKVGSQSGWVSASLVSPTQQAAPATAPPPAPKPTYATTAALNLRTGPSAGYARILVIPKGANVGVILASSGDWRKVTYAGKTGWVHSAYLVKR